MLCPIALPLRCWLRFLITPRVRSRLLGSVAPLAKSNRRFANPPIKFVDSFLS